MAIVTRLVGEPRHGCGWQDIDDPPVLATKFTTNYRAGPNRPNIMANFTGNGSKSLHASVKASLQKLQTDYIDLLYVHWWD